MSPTLGYGERLRQTERAISFIRFGVVAFNSLLYLSLSGPDQRRSLALAIIAIAGVYSVVALVYNPERLAPTVMPVVTMVLDNILIAVWLHATGGFDSPFFPLFYAEAAASVGRFGWFIGTLSAVGSGFLYLWVVSMTRKTYGAGIGLAIARELVRLHRGDVKVSSELDKGARFRVVLPKTQPS